MNIIELPIQFEYEGQPYYIYPSLIVSGEELTLVDTGYPAFMPLIEKEILRLGYDPLNLKNIIITHYDDDHIGALYEFVEKYPSVTVIASEVESPSILGLMKSERLIQAEALLVEMPEEEQASGEEFVQLLKNLRHVPVNQTVRDGECILDGKCQVLATPGHTSGHISLYFPALGIVITGDAAVNEGSALAVANPQYCIDLESAEQSLNRLKALNAQSYYCYHGGKLSF
ncbi:MBL fold metallo-hydrolase [Paenibacillus sp. FSL R7-0297]|uniref:MBL fold metallo-hydrolase n=1 Tax=unclassified Paenibacillus TaxID=185978 RepID=UPI0004F6BBD1|nr:MBL fold metallo-hydrolase [Paenibacillus sp. FSL R5-0912]AIQ41994.1 metal-dependent hydrolase [Paenibacillus sp. FSL R5-0912]